MTIFVRCTPQKTLPALISIIIKATVCYKIDMRSKFAITKLKAILIIDIVIVALAASAYLYVDALPGVSLSTEQIQFVDLQVVPTRITLGQTVAVSVNATSQINEKGVYTAELFLDGILHQTSIISFAGVETKTINFTISQATEGTHVVKIGTLEGSFTVLNMFELSDLAVNRTEASVGEAIGI
ncbi:MAG: hypothetical protein ACQXXJ_00970, partial [Candidatus Bathyarchaeia archaeon]